MKPDPLARFLTLASEQPDAAAIEHDGRTTTYGELAELASRLAAGIRERAAAVGAVPGEDPVGICLQPSVECVAAVLGILGAGYPYLPLDPDPDEASARRLDAIVADCRPWLILVDESSRVPKDSVSVAFAAAVSAGVPDTSGRVYKARDEDELGYVVYTSGSTGTPKGVDMRWGALSNLMTWQTSAARLGRAARTALLTPLTFDVSFQEMFGTLMTGGTLVVLDSILRRDSAALAAELEQQKIERVYLPFVALHMLAEASVSRGAIPSCLRDVVTAGEQLQITPALASFFSALDGAVLHNHYGPAETHVVTAHELHGDPQQWPALPPIGTPVTGVEVLVLDDGGAEVAEGELYLGGACLARGYRNLPNQTNARFGRDPRPGATGRLYRTGDIGRRSVDGCFEWIGRLDDQVKVRGHRVELGEVESVLSRHEDVRHVVVVPRPSGGSNELIAYVQGYPQGEDADDAAHTALGEWKGVWDRTYERTPSGTDPIFDTSGWNSSLTGEPIPAHHMREWVDRTVERILMLKPRRILEVGCGSGLLLHRLAPHCERYVGLDYSEQVIDKLSDVISSRPELKEIVSVSCAAADELDRFPAGSFDLVLLNSVLQHFPSSTYLFDVLCKAVSIADEQGHVFVGDVTPYGFRETFFTWVEATGARDARSEAADITDRVQRRLALDRDLSVDPPFFDLVGAALPRVGRVEVQVKRGREQNELTDFRYDAILHLGAERPAKAYAVAWTELEESRRTVEGLVQLAGSGVCVRGVPNARTGVPWLFADQVQQQSPRQEGVGEAGGIDPDAVFAAAESLGIALQLRPEPGYRTVMVGPVAAEAGGDDDLGSSDRNELSRQLSAHASDPLREHAARRLFPRLRAFAAEQLPDYMRPAGYVLMQTFPRTASGKIDRRRLPPPGHRRPELANAYVAPKTESEKVVERVWRLLLGIDRAGIDDSFFDLGGNSALAVTMASRLGRELGCEVATLLVFEHPTVRLLAARLAADAPPAETESQGTRGGRVRDAYRRRRGRQRAQ